MFDPYKSLECLTDLDFFSNAFFSFNREAGKHS